MDAQNSIPVMVVNARKNSRGGTGRISFFVGQAFLPADWGDFPVARVLSRLDDRETGGLENCPTPDGSPRIEHSRK